MIKMQKTAGHAMQKSYYILVSKPFPTYIRAVSYTHLTLPTILRV